MGPRLAAASNFGHGWDPDLFRQALDLGIQDFRDIIYWSSVEVEPGRYLFEKPTTAYPATVSEADGQMSLTVNWGNQFYDGGATPYSPEGLDALGRFVVAALDANPAITAVEVGNEFNGPNFINGPVKDTKLSERSVAYFELLRAVHTAVKTTHPDIAVLGGAAHSIPGGFLWPVLDLGGADYMDALVLHPYSTPPEHLTRQIAVLRRHDAAKDLPIQVTEFGDKSRGSAPGYMMRMYCAMALSGVERAVWYPLGDRKGDERQALLEPDTGRPSPVGLAFAETQERLAGLPVEEVSPDPFTYGCRFGDRTMVLWGEPRDVFLDSGVEARNAQGVMLDKTRLRLSMEHPLVILGPERLVLGENIRLAPTDIVADSYHQFGYPQADEKDAQGDPFRRFAKRGDRRIRLKTMPGQDVRGAVWTPYLSNRSIRPARVTAEALLPARRGAEVIEIVHRYVAPEDQIVAIEASWNPSERSQDGIGVTVKHRRKVLFEGRSQTSEIKIDIPSVVLKQGDRLDFIVDPGANGDGDLTGYRITLRDAE